ncbi:MAG: hypothetical protein ABI782_04230 [Anaerolineaceae bacterium]
MIDHLQAIFLRGTGYSEKFGQPDRAGIFIVRGLFGGIALFLMATALNPGIKWNMVLGSPWFYIVMFILGACWANVFVWGCIIVWPLTWFGQLDAVTTWIMNMIWFVILMIVMFVKILASYLEPQKDYTKSDKASYLD